MGASVVEINVDSVNYLEGSANFEVKYDRGQTDSSRSLLFPKNSNNEKSTNDHVMVEGL